MLKGVQVPPTGAGVAPVEGVGVVAEVVVAEVFHNIIVLISTYGLPCIEHLRYQASSCMLCI